GLETDADDAAAQLVAFREAGGTLVDTAVSYGFGAAEQILGQLIADVVPRDEVVIATKAGIIRTENDRIVNVGRGELLRRLDQSLQRMGTDYVDLWYVHYVDDTVPFDETLSALDTAVATGKARYAGVSNYCGWRVGRAATWQRAVPERSASSRRRSRPKCSTCRWRSGAHSTTCLRRLSDTRRTSAERARVRRVLRRRALAGARQEARVRAQRRRHPRTGRCHDRAP